MPTRPATVFLLLTCLTALLVAQDAAPERLRVASEAMAGLLVKRVAPNYPPLARQARIQGTVMLNALINKSGDVESVQLMSGHPMLAPAAIVAVKQWKYQPYLQNGEPTAVETNIQVNFVLSETPAGVSGNGPVGAPPRNADSILTNLPPSDDDHQPRVPESVMRALRIRDVDPIYPPLAIQTHIEGTVVLNVVISASGDVESMALISGHPLLVNAAIDAVKQWKYTAYLQSGESIKVRTTVHLNFTLSHEHETEGTVTDGLLDLIPEGTVLQGVVRSTPPPGSRLPQRIRVSSGVAQGLLVTKVDPEYPPDARMQRVQGTVVLKVNIDTAGNVVQVELVSGHPLLAQAAIDSVSQWKYRPYLLNGTPIMVETQVQVNFTLAGS